MSNITKIKVDQTIYDVGTPIDTELSSTSTNPVQNKVITEKLNSLGAEEIGYDDTAVPFEADDVQEAIEKIARTVYPTLIVNVKAGSSITISKDGETITGTADSQNKFEVILSSFGTWNISASLNGKVAEDSIAVSEVQEYSINLSYGSVYGVSWSLSGTSLSRTDDSALFTDPVPYMADGNHPGSSPFDNLMPWSGMIRETIDGNELVRIPKFWYKITKANSALSIQISDKAIDGFYVSPAHRARGSYPEQDYVYIGRYHSDSNYKSTSGVIPIVNITRATARTNQAAIGSGYYQLDFSLWITIWFLYLVEFANWDSQACIGYNCGNNSSKQATGSTDSMPYHTGTMQTSRTTYGVGVQYRYIEDPWGNVVDWCDGITFNQANIYCFENFADYSDDYTSTGATLVGTRPTSSNYIQDFGISSENDFEWFMYPNSVGSSQNNVPDSCYYNATGVVLYVGSSYYRSAELGLFYLAGYNAASYKEATVGVRLQYRPSNS